MNKFVTKTSKKYYYILIIKFTVIILISNQNILAPMTNIITRSKNIISPFFKKITTNKPFKISHNYENDIALVKSSNALSNAEVDIVNKRLSLAATTLNKMFNFKLKYSSIPKIGICCSGGGYRAMLSSLGIFKGLEKIGLLDTCSYVSSLSGSSWFLLPWLLRNIDLDEFEKIVLNQIKTDLKSNLLYKNEIIQAISTKYKLGQPLSLVDLVGVCLGINFFSDISPAGRSCHFSDIANNISSGNYPFPIASAIMPYNNDYKWFEFTPLEIGCSDFSTFIPTWAFDRKFDDGKSVDFNPEPSLGYFLGIFGSAYEINLKEIDDLVKKLSISNKCKENELKGLRNYLTKYLDLARTSIVSSYFGKIRISPAKIYNFMYHLDKTEIPNNIKSKQFINLIDAGIDLNIPISPLLRKERKVDVIIICDASKHISHLLKKTSDYVKSNNIPFPEIDLEKLDALLHKPDISLGQDNDSFSIAILKDDNNPEVPTVIYIPIITDYIYSEKNYGTSKLKYTNEEATKLILRAEMKIELNKESILRTIKNVCLKKIVSKI